MDNTRNVPENPMGGTLELAAGMIKSLPKNLGRNDREYWISQQGSKKNLGKRLEKLLIGDGKINTKDSAWLAYALLNEDRYLESFFGQKFDLGQFATKLLEIGPEKINFWQSHGLEIHFLPGIEIIQGSVFPGWEKPLEGIFWTKILLGNVFREIDGSMETVKSISLPGKVVLIDTRAKPLLGSQGHNHATIKYAHDDNFIGRIVQNVKKKGLLKSKKECTRMEVLSHEWDMYIRFEIAEFIGVSKTQLRLETVIENSIIGQIYNYMPRNDDFFRTQQSEFCYWGLPTFVWLEECVKDSHPDRKSDFRHVRDGGLLKHTEKDQAFYGYSDQFDALRDFTGFEELYSGFRVIVEL